MKNKVLALSLASLLALGWTQAAQATTVVTSTNVPVGICDQCTVSSTLNVGSHLTIGDVNVNLSSLSHSWDGDLLIQLISPTGTTVTLSANHGGSANNYIGTVFDDEASTSIAAGGAPFTGSFRPDQLLSAFDGQDAFGTWTLRVADQAWMDTGSINAWGLSLEGREASNVPEPASLALVSLALAGAAAGRRRKKA